jgi:hypothetical protein
VERSILRNEVLPFFQIFALLLLGTALADFLLHQFQLVWVGRYLGIPGTLLILLSFFYSMRKRKLIQGGSPRVLLRLHETFTWLGALMILVHAGVHFNAILPWLALVAMLVNVISGLVGKLLLERARRHLEAKREGYRRLGLSDTGMDRELFWDAVTLDLMRQWRAVHFPISLAFAVLGLAHILSIFLFWQWQ